ncbi:MAG TPA: hypothetical protein ENI95_02475 [Chloroflexi bacterium]|nr:hypothetical protein [Chloroflexota bacterium]
MPRLSKKRDERPARHWLLSVILAMLAATFLLGAPYFFLAWIGVENPPPGWPDASLPLYVVINAFGAASVLAVYFWWKRWGAYGVLATLATLLTLNIVQGTFRVMDIALSAGLIIVLIILFRPLWPYLK